MSYDTGNKSELQTNGLIIVLNERESAIKGGNEIHGTENMKMLICVIGGIIILLNVIFFCLSVCCSYMIIGFFLTSYINACE